MNGGGDGYKLGQKGERRVNGGERCAHPMVSDDGSNLALYVPRGFTRRVGIALAGSSGQGCLG